MEVHLLHHLL